MKTNLGTKILFVVVLTIIVLMMTMTQTRKEKGQTFKHPNVPAIELRNTQQKLWINPNNQVSLLLYFEKKVMREQSFVKHLSLNNPGVVEIKRVGTTGQVYQILFDFGMTSHVELLEYVVKELDSPLFFEERTFKSSL